MRAAILSDVHGNLAALKSVLDDVATRRVDSIWSLGDLVGYGPDPQACVDLMRREAEVNLLGNHDAAVVGSTSVTAFNNNARAAVDWTRGVMTEEGKDFLKSLPYVERRKDFLLVHSSPDEPPLWHYILNIATARRSFDDFVETACFVGHTHLPFIVEKRPDGAAGEVADTAADFKNGCRYLVNTGSVGQPRDRDPKASYAVVDSSAARVEIIRVPYDIEETQRKMRDVGLPSFLIERLAAGR